jgi:hypothetical protein
MKNTILLPTFLLIVIVSFSSCTSINKSLREPNVLVEFDKSDFTFSDQMSAEATSTRILGLDFERLFMVKTGRVESSSAGISLASLPVIGKALNDPTANFALYEMMNNNSGYDVILYPQYTTKVVKPILGIGFLMQTTTVRATARLGKLNK